MVILYKLFAKSSVKISRNIIARVILLSDLFGGPFFEVAYHLYSIYRKTDDIKVLFLKILRMVCNNLNECH